MLKSKPVDYRLFFTVLVLMLFGMIMISSVSVYSSFKVTDAMVKSWLIAESYNYFYVIRNISHIIISLIFLWIVTKIPYRFFQKNINYIFIWILFLLVFVLIKWMSLKWATWWINIPWIPFTIQPTEFLKFWLILFLANFLQNYKPYLSDLYKWFLPFLWIIWLVVMLVWLQPDFWTLMVLLPVSFIMYFATWADVKKLLILVILGFMLIVSVYFAWTYDKKNPEDRNKLSYITDRIDNFLADNQTAIKNKTINYQTEQGLIAIWSWWFFGLWFGSSIQKFGYLPEVQWDFIFSVIVEELGFIWAFILVNTYLYIVWRWFYIASKVDDLFAKYSAIWISTWFFIQTFINIWVNLNIVPLTWITLPFVSYGGSSLISLCIAVWFLLSISRHMQDRHKYVRFEKVSNIWKQIRNMF